MSRVRADELHAGDYIMHQSEVCMISTRRAIHTRVGDAIARTAAIGFTIAPRKGPVREYEVSPETMIERVYKWPDGPAPPPMPSRKGKRK